MKNIQQKIVMNNNVCEMCNGQGWILVSDDNNYEFGRECECGILKKNITSNMIVFANIPSKYHNLTMDDFKISAYRELGGLAHKAKLAVVNYLEDVSLFEEGKGLYLFSKKTGSGKTMMAAIVANYYLERGRSVRFATSTEIRCAIQDTWNKDTDNSELTLIEMLCDVDLLVIDDFGFDLPKDWLNERFYNIINKRYTNQKPTIFTSNYNLDDLVNIGYDSRIVSRIEESSYLLAFPGESIRKMKAEENRCQVKAWVKDS